MSEIMLAVSIPKRIIEQIDQVVQERGISREKAIEKMLLQSLRLGDLW